MNRRIKKVISYVLFFALLIQLSSFKVVYASTNQYEAENALLSGGAVYANDHSGYTGTGFVGGFTDSNKGNAKVEFQIPASKSSQFKLSLRYANGTGSEKTLSLWVDGNFYKQLYFPATANWDSWNSIIETIYLSQGMHSITYFFGNSDSGNVNIDNLHVESLEPTVIPGKVEAENYIRMNGIATEDCAEGTQNVGWIHNGDWLEYSVNVSESAKYRVDYRIAGVNNSTQILVQVGNNTLATTNIVNTGGWQVYQTVSSKTFQLNAGIQTIRIYFTGEGVNFNYFNIVKDNQTPPVEGGKPDLIVTDISWIPNNPVNGEEVTFKAVIKNQGDGASPQGVIHGVAFLVNGTTVSWSDNVTTSIPAGSSITVTANGGPYNKGSWTAATGNYTIRAIVDDINRIDESNENNNTYDKTMVVDVPKKPDLTVTDITWQPSAPVAGNLVTFSAVVENKGTVATLSGIPCNLSFYVNGIKVSWVSNYTSSIPAGGKVTLTQTGGNFIATNGIHNVRAVVDEENLIDEIDETNNSFGKSLSIGVVENYGATVPYDTYEAEAQNLMGASLISYDTTWCSVASEASGRRAVRLEKGQSIEFTIKNKAQGIVVRYSMPDSATGADIYQNLSVYVNGVHTTDMTFTNRYAHQYGQYGSDGGEMQWSNTPGINHHRYFDESRILLEKEYASRSSFKLQWDANDYNPNGSSYIIIDFIETEAVPQALTKPSNYVSITDFGAIPNDGLDDTAAMNAAIKAVNGTTIKGIWIPEGTFHFNTGTRGQTKIKLPKGVSVQGAGMWRSTLTGAFAGFYLQEGNVTLADFTIKAEETYRSNASGIAGLEGNAQNSTIINLWIQHTKVGLWLNEGTVNALVSKCRVRDTWADGINLNGGTKDTIVEHCNFRNTGDDGMAMWSKSLNGGSGTVENCTFRNNTVQIPNLANGIGIYGGKNNTVSNNLILDVVDNGSGIQFGTNHGPSAFTGTLTISNNKLVRAGSWHHDYGYQIGAIWGYWINNNGLAQNLTVSVSNNLIDSSIYSGIFTEESNVGTTVKFTDNRINNSGTYGVHIRDSARGSAVFQNNTANGSGLVNFKNDSPNFTVSGTGNSW
ncbi:CARDB domain-containing protein [Lachnoclostridium phytofermentans]|uniref:Carbohydrate binding family 6 n=1 Tax=Lachnoclostridium phytofermentans (strain ATCC 700394 / DSM 18823 / ISDg) TaxID=357809 RepID=A9KT31_LACP7|nr:CARDB domain-containing protein [Lachnoclostridium phytofermentans]ABX42242.1 Carbohydrate binding family 6 [Lachnoclostridium phytofermentans ISDg]